jgi:hypothetical protein
VTVCVTFFCRQNLEDLLNRPGYRLKSFGVLCLLLCARSLSSVLDMMCDVMCLTGCFHIIIVVITIIIAIVNFSSNSTTIIVHVHT